MKGVILAGGKGVRLRPFTYLIPKPLMPIGEIPIIELIILQLKNHGIDNLFLSTGYKENLIKLFLEGLDKRIGVTLSYSNEKQSLGTVGPLSLIKKELTEDFILMNGDTLCSLNFSDLVAHHKKSGNMVTVSLHKTTQHIDFGVVKLDENNDLVDYIEKPTNFYYVSMGVYVFSPEVFKYIPEAHLDFPDLIKKLIAHGEKIGGYISDDFWLDIGRTEDYIRANENTDSVYKKLGVKVNNLTPSDEK